jgi:hypothetical protein
MERMSHPRWTPGETTEQVRALFIAPSFFFFLMCSAMTIESCMISLASDHLLPFLPPLSQTHVSFAPAPERSALTTYSNKLCDN